MKNLLEFLLLHLVTNPEDIAIDESTDYDTTVYTINVHPDDIGRVIGRKGNIIKAIRKISQIKLVKENMHARIEIAD